MKVLMVLITQLFVDMCLAKKNVLLIISDDLGCRMNYTSEKDFLTPIHPKMHTPNIDKLSDKSLVLTRCYVQQALCGPSRTSFLTGRRPDTTGIHGNGGSFRERGGDFTTLPQFFKKNKYVTIGIGKIFHPRHNLSDPISWTEKRHVGGDHITSKYTWTAVSAEELEEHGPLFDQKVAMFATEELQKLAPKPITGEQPFFLGVGFHKPHLPFKFDGKFLEYYPEESIRLPNNQFVPDGMPEVAWGGCKRIHDPSLEEGTHTPSHQPNATFPDQVVKNLRRAYYATVSYIDSLVGDVLKKLHDVGLADNTVVIFCGDHGFSLGEHNIWGKSTNFEEATRAPMMIHIPGKTDNGIVIRNVTEFVDLMPTVIQAAGFDPLSLCPSKSNNVTLCTEGSSLLSLIDDPSGKDWKKAAFSQTSKGTKDGIKVLGYTMRTDQYRYTEWPEFTYEQDYEYRVKSNWGKLHGVELYDYEVDPDGNYNVAEEEEYEEIAKELSKQLRAGWRPVQEKF